MERRPLVLDGGLVRQLPPGDTLPGMGGSDPDRLLEYIATSRVVAAPFAGHVRFRCMGAGGGGGYASSARGGNGGTVAKSNLLEISAGDEFVVAIPAGGQGAQTTATAGSSGGTLTVTNNGISIISIPGGIGGAVAGTPGDNTAPTGAAWYVLGGRGGNGDVSGGGGAMIVEGGTAAGRGGNGNQSGGGGAMGNGGDSNNSSGGGLLTNAVGTIPGTGFLAPEDCVLLFTMMTTTGNRGQVFSGGVVGNNGWGAFGGGGGGGAATNLGGFAGGGGGSTAGPSHGGFGGGGAGSSTLAGGNGGQGFVTVEWLRG